MLVACDGKTSLCAPAVGMLAVRNGCAPVGRPFPAGAVPVAAPRGGGGAGPARRACGRAQCWLAVAGCFVSPALLSTGGRSVQEGVRVRDSSRVLLRVIQVRISGRLAERCRLRTRVCRARGRVRAALHALTGHTAVAGGRGSFLGCEDDRGGEETAPASRELVPGRACCTTRASVSSVEGAGQHRSTQWSVRGHRRGMWRSMACETGVAAGSGRLSAGCRACSGVRHRSACAGQGREGVASGGDFGARLSLSSCCP